MKRFFIQPNNKIYSFFIIISLSLVFLRLLFISGTMLIDDEAYYAMYARHLDWGYIDHGPVVGFIIKIFTFFGENAFTIRIGATLMMAFLATILYRFGKTHFNKTTGMVLSLGISANMLFHTNSIVITPDLPLTFFTVLAIVYYYKAYCVDADKYLIPAGIFLGLAMLSKVSALFPAMGIALFPFLVKEKRYILRNINFYGSFITAFLVFLPFIIWNLQNDLAFFRYQGSHISRAGNIENFAELWGSLFILLGPVYFFYATVQPYINLSKWKNLPAPIQYFTVITIIPMTYFLVHSFFSRLEANWPAPVFFGGLFLMAITNVGERWEKRRGQLLLQLIFSLVLILTVTIQTFNKFIPLKGKNDITNRYFIYNSFKSELKKFLNENPIFKDYRILANNFQIPSMINVYLKPNKEAICLSIGYHETLYSFIYKDQDLIGKNYLFISNGKKFPKKCENYFKEITLLKQFSSRRNEEKIKNYSIWLVKGYKGKSYFKKV